MLGVRRYCQLRGRDDLPNLVGWMDASMRSPSPLIPLLRQKLRHLMNRPPCVVGSDRAATATGTGLGGQAAAHLAAGNLGVDNLVEADGTKAAGNTLADGNVAEEDSKDTARNLYHPKPQNHRGRNKHLRNTSCNGGWR